MKCLYTLLLPILLVACRPTANKMKSTSVDVSQLKRHKNQISIYSSQHKNSFLVFAKVANKQELVKVVNEKWPDDTECAYNILKNDDGKIIMILSSPVSESGDWYLKCTHYFNNDGNTFIYEIKANAFALPDDEVAYETTTDYFGADFKLLKHNYKLVDKKGKALDKQIYGFEAASRGFNIKAYSNVHDCLAAYHIQLPN